MYLIVLSLFAIGGHSERDHNNLFMTYSRLNSTNNINSYYTVSALNEAYQVLNEQLIEIDWLATAHLN